MSRFDECLKFVLEREGGYVNNPADRGGATNKGVTQKVYDDYRRTFGRLEQPVMLISDEEVAAIYKRGYWVPIKGDSLPKGVDLCVFDAAVNHGVKQATKFLQRAIGVDDDGVIGPQTISAVQKDEASGMLDEVVASLIAQREMFYNKLVDNNASQHIFLNGWMARIDKLRDAVA